MPLKIRCGFQTGADIAAARAAVHCGLPISGYMPANYLTEDGPRPDFAALYNAIAIAGGYPERTRANVRDSDATIWFGDPESRGGRLTLATCREERRPYLVVRSAGRAEVGRVVDWVVREYVGVLNVAGNRESVSPGIGERVERFLVEVFTRLAY